MFSDQDWEFGLMSRQYLKWCLMVAVTIWVQIYRLSILERELPEFIYVNF